METEYSLTNEPKILRERLILVRSNHDKENPYCMIRKESIQNNSLSYEARGMLGFLLSQKEGRPIKPKDLIVKGVCGRDKVYSILTELEQARHLKRPEKYQDAKGRWKWQGTWEVFEEPYPEKPYTDKPYTDKPNTENTDTKDINTKDQSIEDQSIKDSVAPEVATASPKKTEPRKRNPFYDAIYKVWKYTAALNGEMQKMLQGTSTRKGFKEYNLDKPLTPEGLLCWADWYRETELGGDEDLNMLEERIKVQSSISRWQQLGEPGMSNTPNADSPQDRLSKTPLMDVKQLKRQFFEIFRSDFIRKERAGYYADRYIPPDMKEWIGEENALLLKQGFTQEQIDLVKGQL